MSVPFLRHRLSPSLALLAVLALLLDGCALRGPVEAPVADRSVREARLLALDAWQARGRIAVKSDHGGGQGDLLWEQQGDAARIRLSGPFGAGAYEIRWDAQNLSITSRNGEFTRAYSGADAVGEFLAEQLGWSFPATSIRYWLLGLADPALAVEQTWTADGELAMLRQNGWSVSYERFTVHDGLALPARLTALGPGGRVRLIVDHWSIAGSFR